MSKRFVAACLLACLASSSASQAGFVSVAIDSLVNADLRLATAGNNYPIAPTTLTVGGVDFGLVPFGSSTDSLGIYGMPFGNSGVSITTSIFNATTVYTLINSGFGTFDAVNGRIEFAGTGGAFASFDLKQGFNIRDHFQNVFNNIVTDPTIVTANFGGGVRLDRQTFVLPVSFANQTLTAIHFIGTNAGSEGVPFTAGVTVETAEVSAVPEPGSLTLLGLGSLGLVGFARRRRNAV